MPGERYETRQNNRKCKTKKVYGVGSLKIYLAEWWNED